MKKIRGKILLWSDSDNYIRFERTLFQEPGRALTTGVLLEEREGGYAWAMHSEWFQLGNCYLRVELKGRQMLPAVSPDAETWRELKPIDTLWPKKIHFCDAHPAAGCRNDETTRHALTLPASSDSLSHNNLLFRSPARFRDRSEGTRASRRRIPTAAPRNESGRPRPSTARPVDVPVRTTRMNHPRPPTPPPATGRMLRCR